jgi:hypothetical protein
LRLRELPIFEDNRTLFPDEFKKNLAKEYQIDGTNYEKYLVKHYNCGGA